MKLRRREGKEGWLSETLLIGTATSVTELKKKVPDPLTDGYKPSSNQTSHGSGSSKHNEANRQRRKQQEREEQWRRESRRGSLRFLGASTLEQERLSRQGSEGWVLGRGKLEDEDLSHPRAGANAVGGTGLVQLSFLSSSSSLPSFSPSSSGNPS